MSFDQCEQCGEAKAEVFIYKNDHSMSPSCAKYNCDWLREEVIQQWTAYLSAEKSSFIDFNRRFLHPPGASEKKTLAQLTWTILNGLWLIMGMITHWSSLSNLSFIPKPYLGEYFTTNIRNIFSYSVKDTFSITFSLKHRSKCVDICSKYWYNFYPMEFAIVTKKDLDKVFARDSVLIRVRYLGKRGRNTNWQTQHCRTHISETWTYMSNHTNRKWAEWIEIRK